MVFAGKRWATGRQAAGRPARGSIYMRFMGWFSSSSTSSTIGSTRPTVALAPPPLPPLLFLLSTHDPPRAPPRQSYFLCGMAWYRLVWYVMACRSPASRARCVSGSPSCRWTRVESPPRIRSASSRCATRSTTGIYELWCVYMRRENIAKGGGGDSIRCRSQHRVGSVVPFAESSFQDFKIS